MTITITLTPVEIDALQTVYGPGLEEAIHQHLLPLVQKTADARLQRLATLYRQLPPADQLEAAQLLSTWREQKQRPVPPVDPPVDPPSPDATVTNTPTVSETPDA